MDINSNYNNNISFGNIQHLSLEAAKVSAKTTSESAELSSSGLSVETDSSNIGSGLLALSPAASNSPAAVNRANMVEEIRLSVENGSYDQPLSSDIAKEESLMNMVLA